MKEANVPKEAKDNFFSRDLTLLPLEDEPSIQSINIGNKDTRISKNGFHKPSEALLPVDKPNNFEANLKDQETPKF